MRYIIFEDFAGKAVPFLFPNKVEFFDMREQLPYATVLSAGEVIIENGVFKCFGFAKDLELGAKDEDNKIITAFFSPHH